VPVDDQGQRPFAKGASSEHGTGQELRCRGQRYLAIETNARLTRNVGHVASVVTISARSGEVSDLLRRPHALTVPFVGSPLLPAFRGAIRGRALRLVILAHVFASSNPDCFGFLINANVLKPAPDSTLRSYIGPIICSSVSSSDFVGGASPVMRTLSGIQWVEKAAVLSAYGLRWPAWAWG